MKVKILTKGITEATTRSKKYKRHRGIKDGNGIASISTLSVIMEHRVKTLE